jgi:RHS repeat-associated protein
MVGGPPTISIMGMAMKAGAAVLGKLAKAFKKIQKKSKRWKALSKRVQAAAKKAMDKLGVPKSARNRVHRAICSVTGHPVDIATGKVFTDAVDFQLPGPLPLVWERVWFSTSTYNGPLGRGWHHSYDLGLVDEGEAVAIRLPDGRPIAFPPIAPGESVFDRTERLTLSRSHEGYSVRNTEGISFHFGIVTFDSPVQKLLAITNRQNFRIDLSYDKHGHLSAIRDSAGRQLSVSTDHQGRITEIRAPHPDEPRQTFPLVRYEYDHSGLLVATRDPLDHAMTFEYTPGGLLLRETNRNGLTFHFEYDADSPDARCLHTWGDGGIYERWLHYDTELRRTIVTNSLGHKTTHFANENGLVTRVVDPLGYASESAWTEFNQPASSISPLGLPTAWNYDARGNTVAEIAPDGSAVQIDYNSLDLLTAIQQPSGAKWNWSYDAVGQLLSRTDATGRQIQFRWDSGLLAEITAADGSSTRFSWDSSSQLSSLTAPNGLTLHWKYDDLGRTVETLSPAGSQRRWWDLASRPVRVAEPDGNLRSLAWDPEGNLLHYGDVHKNIRFTYQGMNRLATRREAGHTVAFHYNTEEDLTSVTNEHGNAWRFEYDENRELIREYGFDQLRRIYTRDAAGRVVRLERSSGAVVHYTHDPLDRITCINYGNDHAENWTWDADGQLLAAASPDCTVRFERDAAGRILREWQDDFWVESRYDAVGRRREMRSCFGAVQTIERNSVGDAVGVTAATTSSTSPSDPAQILWQTRIRHDQLGMELERELPGGIRSRWERDQTGRPIQHQILRDGNAVRDVRYEWDVNYRLKRIVSAQTGAVSFEFDAAGNLAAASFENGLRELRTPDAVGNLYKTSDRSDRRYGKSGELLESRDERGTTRYEYDTDGNLARKITPEGTWHYAWDPAGMLKTVVRPDGKTITFRYDALGRRISRTTDGKTTRWIWDGNNPLHEWIQLSPEDIAALEAAKPAVSPAKTTAQLALTAHPATGPPDEPELEPKPLLPAPHEVITWLFDPDTLRPAAKLQGEHAWSIVTDYLGTPTTMLDENGRTVWSADLSIYGQIKNLTTADGQTHTSCPFRWLGQYEDEDTGLYYNRFRYYDPATGTYISHDPIRLAGGLNICAYVHDPLTWVDPMGLSGCDGNPARPRKGKFRGGSHADMSGPRTKGDGLDSHHMPDRHANPTVHPNDGPAIQMDPSDHHATSSNGRHGSEAARYRAETAQMISEGRYRDAMAREIRDVRRAAREVSNDPRKYNEAIQEMLEYSRRTGQLPPRN